MRNKWFLFVVIVIILSSCNYFGNDRNKWSAEEMSKRQTEMMTDLLDLNEEQIEQVAALNKEFSENISSVRKKAKGDRDLMMESMRTLRQEKDDALKEILTEEQFEKYKEFETNRRQKRMKNGPARDRGER